MSMPAYVPTYFLARTRNNPPDGLIKLGNLIISPELPDEPIELAKPLPITNGTTHDEEGWKYDFGKKTDVSNSIGASFLESLLGAGGDAGVSWLRENSQEWSCEKMITYEFQPTEAWLKDLVADAKVRERLNKMKFWKRSGSFYVVVGVKVAIAASLVAKFARGVGLHLHASVDLTPATTIPISAHTDQDVMRERHRHETVGKIDDFVIGYRLRRLKISRTGDIKKNQQHNDGAAFRQDDGRIDNTQNADISVDELEAHDVQGWELKMETTIMTESEGSTKYACVKTGLPG
ncbi:hypothetical protein N0V83_000082 [Neocucurbitaria cava]|uniref:Uncharacterized protein n=1 Tax=Neocucurbitaria cava TaxID=798079 RepID=A0A9W9CRS4_9PLEO|nr:hypothetical protein N0V83_000082 [Neocucurbitaria cava]